MSSLFCFFLYSSCLAVYVPTYLPDLPTDLFPVAVGCAIFIYLARVRMFGWEEGEECRWDGWMDEMVVVLTLWGISPTLTLLL